MCIDVLGLPVRVVVPASVAARVGRLLADFPVATTADRELRIVEDRHQFRLLDGDVELMAAPDEDTAAAGLVWAVNGVAADAPDRLLIHAGAVAAAGAVLLPGSSGAGKSTLTRDCVGAGLDFLGDDRAVLDVATGACLPFPKPLDLSDRGLVPPSEVRPGALAPARRVAAVVFPQWAAGAPTSITALTPDAGLLALASHAVNLERLGR